MWKYIRFICNIILKKRSQYTNEEYVVWMQIIDKKLDWFLEEKTEDEEEKEKQQEKLEKLEELVTKILENQNKIK